MRGEIVEGVCQGILRGRLQISPPALGCSTAKKDFLLDAFDRSGNRGVALPRHLRSVDADRGSWQLDGLHRVARGGYFYGTPLTAPGFGQEPPEEPSQASPDDGDEEQRRYETQVRVLAARLRVRVDKEAGKMTPKWIVELAASRAVGLGAGLSASSGPRR